MSIKSTSLRTAVAAAVLAIASTALYAESAPIAGVQLDAVQHSTAVRYSDLNLALPSDVAELYRRISIAADQVCGPRALTGSYSASAGYTRCFDRAVEHAVAHVGQPALTAFYQEKLQRSGPHELAVASQ
ncbi:MAG TPA: UrcA family protein [Steroidobacteraceae bacterium]|nr:UrcA family protein [Steroidobacteraceae bacterium]